MTKTKLIVIIALAVCGCSEVSSSFYRPEAGPQVDDLDAGGDAGAVDAGGDVAPLLSTPPRDPPQRHDQEARKPTTASAHYMRPTPALLAHQPKR